MDKKLIKKIVFIQLAALLLFSPIIFGTLSDPTADDDVNLYAIYNSLDKFKATEDFDFTHTLRVSTDSRVLTGGAASDLNVNAEICPGTVTTTSTIAGKWASPGHYAYATYFYTCNPPAWTGTPTQNINMHWNTGNYDSLAGKNTCLKDDASCWGKEGTLTNQKVNTYEGLSDGEIVYYNDRRGSMSTVCKGTNTIRMRDDDSGGYFGATDTEGTTNGDTTFDRQYNLAEGDWEAQSQFAVQGCATVLRRPACDGAQSEHIYSRTSSWTDATAPHYSLTLPRQDFNFKVVNRQFTASAAGSSPDPSVALCMQPGETKDIVTLARNTGDSNDAIISVNSVSANNGFLAVPTGDIISGPVSFEDGFNAPIQPLGRAVLIAPNERNTYARLTAPASLGQGITSTTLTYTYAPTENTCTSTASKTFNVNYLINGSVDCEPPKEATCTLIPDSATLFPNQSRDFAIVCFDKSVPTSCGAVTWGADAALDPDFLQENNNFAIVQFGNPGTGELTADAIFINGKQASCSADITVNQFPNRCELDPDSANVNPGDATDFDLTCFQNSLPASCGSVGWSADPALGADFVSQSSTGATVEFNTPNSNGLLTATTTVGVCTSDISVSNQTIQNGCFLNPNQVNLDPNERQRFNITCITNGLPVSCVTTVWRADPALGPNYITRARQFSIIEFTEPNSNGLLTASTAAGYVCTADVSVGLFNGCELEPDSANVNPGNFNQFNLTCYENSQQINCGFAIWDADAVLDPYFLTRTRFGATVQFNNPNTNGLLTVRTAKGTCSSDVSVSGMVRGCDIDPDPVILDPFEDQVFNVTCFENSQPINCGSLSWGFTGNLNPNTIAISPDSTQLTAEFRNENANGNVIAAMQSGYSCTSDVATTGFPPEANACVISAPGTTFEKGASVPFNINCFVNFVNVGCSGVTWSAQPQLDATFLSTSNSNAVAVFNSENRFGSVNAVASFPGYTCSLNLSIIPAGGNKTCVGPDCGGGGGGDREGVAQTCRLSDTLIVLPIGVSTDISVITCRNDDGNPVQCPDGDVIWSLNNDQDPMGIVDIDPSGKTATITGVSQWDDFLIARIGDKECRAHLIIGGLVCANYV